MSSVVSLPRLRLLLVSFALLTGALAGCLGNDDIDPLEGVHPGCENAVEIKILEGGRLDPHTMTVGLPVTLCITNEDTDGRNFHGMEQRLPKPDWVPEPAVPDPHAEHRGNPYVPIGPLTIQSGETYVLQGLDYHGVVMMMEVEDMDNFAIWEFLPATPQTYPSYKNQVILTGSTTGDTDAGDTTVYDLEVRYPDLTSIRLDLRWDDSADDSLPGGEATNRPDELEIRLIDPAGNEVVTRKADGRSGNIRFTHDITIPAFPADVTAVGLSNATQLLREERPFDTSLVGTWKVEVSVLSAPGLFPDEDGSTKGLPGGDGHQEWSLQIQLIHLWAALAVPDAKPSADLVEANL